MLESHGEFLSRGPNQTRVRSPLESGERRRPTEGRTHLPEASLKGLLLQTGCFGGPGNQYSQTGNRGLCAPKSALVYIKNNVATHHEESGPN